MSLQRRFSATSNPQSRMVLSRDQLFAQIATSTKLVFTNAAKARLERSSIQWLQSIWNYIECKPDFWRAAVTSPNTFIGTGGIRLALEIRPF